MSEKKFYAAFVFIGLVIPSIFTVLYSMDQVNKWGVFGMYEALMLSPVFYQIAFSNYVSSQLLVDILITTIIFFFWAYREAKKYGMKHFWIYPLITYSIAFSFAFPLFFYYRQKAILASEGV